MWRTARCLSFDRRALVRIANMSAEVAVAVAAVGEDHLQLAPRPAAVGMCRCAAVTMTAPGRRA